MEAVPAVHHVVIEFEVLFGDVGLARRMVLHEPVAEVIDLAEVGGDEVPRTVLHQPGRDGMVGQNAGDLAGDGFQPTVLVLVHFPVVGHEQLDRLRVDVLRPHPQPRDLVAQLVGKDAPPRQLGTIALVLVAHHLSDDQLGDVRPVDRLGGVPAEPIDHVRRAPLLMQDVPDRLDLAVHRPERTRFAGGLVHLREAVDAVLVGPLAGGDGVPQHRTQVRLQRHQVAHHPPLDQRGQVRHLPLVHQRRSHLPVRRVPTNQQHLSITHGTPSSSNNKQARSTGFSRKAIDRVPKSPSVDDSGDEIG